MIKVTVLLSMLICLPLLNGNNLNRPLYVARCILNTAERYFPPEKTLAISWPKTNISLVNRNPFKIHTSPIDNLFFKELNQWSICIYRTKVKWHRELFFHGGYIVFSYYDFINDRRTTRTFMHQMMQLYTSNTWNAHAPFVVVLMNAVDNPPLVAGFYLGAMKWHKIMNSVVIISDNKTGNLNLYTWYPEKCDSFKVVCLDTWVMEDEGFYASNADLFPAKTDRNFHGCPLRAITHPARPSVGLPVYTRTYLNKTYKLNISYNDGWEVKLYKIILHKLNMTEKYVIPRFGVSGDFDSYLRSDKADVAFSAYISRYESYFSTTRGYHWDTTRWYVPCGKKYPRWDSISRMFQWLVWISWIAGVLLSGGILTLLSRHALEAESYKSFLGSLTYSCAVTLGISVHQKPKTSPLRCFFLSWVCYSFALDTVFQTFLTTYLIDPGMIPAVANMKELLNSDLAMGVSYKQLFFFNNTDDPTGMRVLQKWINCYFNRTCYEWAAQHHNLSLLATEMWFNNISATLEKTGIGRSSLCTIEGGDVETVFTVMFLQRGSLYLDHFNRIIDGVVESGIFRHWTQVTYHEHKLLNRTNLEKGSSDEYCQLTMELMQSVFFLLLMGYCIGVITLISECIYHSVSGRTQMGLLDPRYS
ncbi:Ionotropic receptor 581 [Blattella germanica]|nr:Ionotropic receptor 581 [Blattella germanica]